MICEIVVGKLTYHAGHQPTWWRKCDQPAEFVMHGKGVFGRTPVCDKHRQELDYERWAKGYRDPVRPTFTPMPTHECGHYDQNNRCFTCGARWPADA